MDSITYNLILLLLLTFQPKTLILSSFSLLWVTTIFMCFTGHLQEERAQNKSIAQVNRRVLWCRMASGPPGKGDTDLHRHRQHCWGTSEGDSLLRGVPQSHSSALSSITSASPAGTPSGKILFWSWMKPHMLCSCRAEILCCIHPYSIHRRHPMETSLVFPAHKNLRQSSSHPTY